MDNNQDNNPALKPKVLEIQMYMCANCFVDYWFPYFYFSFFSSFLFPIFLKQCTPFSVFLSVAYKFWGPMKRSFLSVITISISYHRPGHLL